MPIGISALERGRRNPTVITVYELAQVLGVSHMLLLEPDAMALAEEAKP